MEHSAARSPSECSDRTRSGRAEAAPGLDALSLLREGAREKFPCANTSDSAAKMLDNFALTDHSGKQTPDASKFWSPKDRVLAIGDDHGANGIKDHTRENMQRYAAAGATALGMENIRTGAQKVLDDYAQARRANPTSPEAAAARDKVRAEIAQSQESATDTPEQKKEGEAKLEKHLKVLDAAVDARIKPIAIEPNVDNAMSDAGGFETIHAGMRSLSAKDNAAFDAYTNRANSPDERATARKQLEGAGLDDKWFKATDQALAAGMKLNGLRATGASAEEDAPFRDSMHDARNRTWAGVIDGVLKQDPAARMIVFAGREHFQYGHPQERMESIPSVNERLARRGYGTTVFGFTGGDVSAEKGFEHPRGSADDSNPVKMDRKQERAADVMFRL